MKDILPDSPQSKMTQELNIQSVKTTEINRYNVKQRQTICVTNHPPNSKEGKGFFKRRSTGCHESGSDPTSPS